MRPYALLALLAATVALPAEPKLSARLIVDQEAAFERTVIEAGTRAGFLSVLAESSVTLTPAPLPARARYESEPESPARLRWRPDLAAISAAGDFGFSSGPWLYYKAATGDDADGSGHYLTVWRRTDPSHWQVWLDGGISYGLTASGRARHLDVEPKLRAVGRDRAASEDCESLFLALWKTKNRERALKEYAAEDLRLLEDGRPPLDGLPAIRSGDALLKERLEKALPARRSQSATGDLKVVYGEYVLAPQADRDRRRLEFVQVWDASQHCHLALELTTPLPAAP